MIESNIFDYFRYFSNQDLKEFQTYLNKFHKGKKNPNKVFTYIKNYHPDYNSSELGWEYAFKKIFRGEKYNYRKITDATYKLCELVKDFLSERELVKDDFQRQWSLLLGLKRIGQTKLFFKLVDELIETYTAKGGKDMWSFLKVLKLHHIAYFTTDKEKIDTTSNRVSLALTALESFYLAARLRYVCEILSQETLLQKGFGDSLTYPLSLENIGKKSSKEFYHEIFTKSISLINEKSSNDFFQLKEIYLQSNLKISKRDQIAVMMYLANFTAQSIRNDKPEFYQEAFDVYEFGIENKLLIEDGYISTTTFLNIVNTACYLKKYDWASDFISCWKKHLERNVRQDIVKISFAHLSFAQEDYPETLKRLKDQKFKNLFFKLVAKGLMMMSQYELNPFEDDLSRNNDNFQKFLQRDNVLTHSFTRAWLNFSQIFGRILTYNPNKPSSKKRLLTDLNDKDEIIKKYWLLEKIGLLEG